MNLSSQAAQRPLFRLGEQRVDVERSENIATEKRQLLHGLLERVILIRSDGRKLATHKPIDDRTEIIVRGGQVLQPVPPLRAA